MSDIGAPPELAWLPVDKLDVDPAYQRTLDTKASQKLITKIAETFRWISFQAILATPVGQGDARRWLIIDGQHRVAAAKQRGIPHVPAVVVAEASQAEQASAFVGANRDRVSVSPQVLFHARLMAGDPDCATVARICRNAGVEFLRYSLATNKVPAGKSVATPALLRSLRLYGEERTGAAVMAVAEHFAAQPTGLRSAFFLAAAHYLHGGGNIADLRCALNELGIEGLERSGVGLNGPHSIAAKAEAIRGCQAKAGDSAVPRRTIAGDDPAGRLPARRMAGATEVAGRDSRERPAPSPPRRAAKPIPPARPSDDDAIARFLAEKGATKVPPAFAAPSQQGAITGKEAEAKVAAFEAKSEMPRLGDVVSYLRNCGRQAWSNGRDFKIDGNRVSRAEFYRLANDVRRTKGLLPYRLPGEAA